LIFVSAPGAPARQLRLPRNWPWWIVAVSVLSLSMSLLAGRKVRAWVDEGADRIAHTDMAALALAGYSLRSTRAKPGLVGWPARTTPFFSVWSSMPQRFPNSLRRLRLFDVNAKRSLAVLPFARDGVADPDAFLALRQFMRCRRTGHTLDMNPRLIQMLLRISQQFKAAELQIISAHRAADGVVTSETSQHNFGNASDIRVSGVPVEVLAQAARDLGAGGVGTYFRNRFVHVDVREKRYFWREETAVLEAPPAEGAGDVPAEGAADVAPASSELPVTDGAEPAAAPAEAEPAAASPEAPAELPEPRFEAPAADPLSAEASP
jgi:uncharacterized protein YcbK (DUF882 family)